VADTVVDTQFIPPPTHLMPILVDAIARMMWESNTDGYASEYPWPDLNDEAREPCRLVAAGLIGVWMDARGLDLVNVAARYFLCLSLAESWTSSDPDDRADALALGRRALDIYRELWQ
jgi:hypothetical protein